MHFNDGRRGYVCNLNIPVSMRRSLVTWDEEYRIPYESVSFIACLIVHNFFFNFVIHKTCILSLSPKKWKRCVICNMNSLVPLSGGKKGKKNPNPQNLWISNTKTNVVPFIFNLLQQQGIITTCNQHWLNKIRLFTHRKKKPPTQRNIWEMWVCVYYNLLLQRA